MLKKTWSRFKRCMRYSLTLSDYLLFLSLSWQNKNIIITTTWSNRSLLNLLSTLHHRVFISGTLTSIPIKMS